MLNKKQLEILKRIAEKYDFEIKTLEEIDFEKEEIVKFTNQEIKNFYNELHISFEWSNFANIKNDFNDFDKETYMEIAA